MQQARIRENISMKVLRPLAMPTFSDNDGWCDDTSDGPVQATVRRARSNARSPRVASTIWAPATVSDEHVRSISESRRRIVLSVASCSLIWTDERPDDEDAHLGGPLATEHVGCHDRSMFSERVREKPWITVLPGTGHKL